MARDKSSADELHVMSFGDHIEELRRRLIFGLLGLSVVFCVMLWYARTIVAWIFAPLTTVQHMFHLPAQTFIRSTLGGMTVYMKVAFIGSLIIAAPWLMYQAWKFISAGLYAAERRAATFLVGLSSIMTALALALTYWILLPAAVVFLLQFTLTYPAAQNTSDSFLHWWSQRVAEWNHSILPTAPAGSTRPAPATDPTTHVVIPTYKTRPENPVEGEIWYDYSLSETCEFRDGAVIVYSTSPQSLMAPMIDPTEYLSEAIFLALGVVVVFHVPVVMCVLGMSGLVNPQSLGKRRMIVFFCCFLGAFLFVPGQDLFSNVAIPLIAYLLFEFGLILMAIFYRRHEKRKAAEAARDAAEEPAGD